MARENKTQPTKISWKDYLKSKDFTDEQKKEAEILVKFFEKTTGWKTVMWGDIFGYGKYHYKSKSCEGDWMTTAFAMRKAGPTIYTICGYENKKDLLAKIGKYKMSGKSCLVFKSVEDIDLKVLEKLVTAGLRELRKNYQVK